MDTRPRSRISYDRAAFLYVGVTFLLGIGSLHSQNNLLFIAFGIAVGVLLVSGSYSWASLARVRVRRHVPSRGEVGRALTVRYHVTTSARVLPAGALLLREVDGADGYEAPVVAAVATVLLGSPARATARVTPTKRGVLCFDRLDISSRFPFGAVKKTVRMSLPATVLIRPRPLLPSPEAVRAATDAHRSSVVSLDRTGEGEEVFGLREYAPGDPVRRIAWRSSARHGRLVVRQFAASVAVAVRISLRLDPLLSEEANEEALSLAAGTLILLHRQGQQAAMYDPAAPERLIIPLGLALDALARVDASCLLPAARGQATIVIEAKETGAVLRAVRQGAHAGAVS